ncbi:MAG: VWA domain-containing protein, partial [Phycisphaerae bacterium]|nr:VWA domain-containing protein [Phycisphaerae bacterium]
MRKRGKLVLGAGLCLVLFAALAGSARAGLEPDSVVATLNPGDVLSESKTATLTGVIPKGDILFSFDLTGSMMDEIETVKVRAIEILNRLDSLVADARYGVMSYMDYPAYYSSCGYSQQYGSTYYGDYAYLLNLALTDNKAQVSSSINSLVLGSGEDGPQDYGRVFYESYADTGIGYRAGAKKILVNFGDAVPHDCNVAEGIPGGPAPYSTGSDPGRDAVIGTPDDLDFQQVLAGMAAHQVTLLNVYSGGSFDTWWAHWTSLTGGASYDLTAAADIPDAIVGLIGTEATRFDTVTLGVCTDGFEEWLTSVDPPFYANVTAPATLDFDIDITVPEGTAGGTYEFTICLLGDGSPFGSQEVVITVPGGGDEPVPTNEWINVYCGYPLLNGVPLSPGDVIRAYDPDGVLCG